MTRKYDKTGLFSKKIKQYLSKGELDNILLSIKKFEDWILKSKKGDKISYYRGYIMAPHLQKLSPTMDERRVRNLKNRVYHAYENSVVTLIQRRHGDLDYEYIAVRV
tara:strand:- start:135 stop:455 length:321 start_codon:yes stop_codon:yes gene_type:complete